MMDITTHEMRSANWKTIIQNCRARPDRVTVKQWLVEQGVSEKSYYYWQRKFRQKAYQMMTTGSTHEPVSAGLAFAEIPFCRAAEPNDALHPNVVIQKGRLRIELNSSISYELLIRILETVSHVPVIIKKMLRNGPHAVYR